MFIASNYRIICIYRTYCLCSYLSKEWRSVFNQIVPLFKSFPVFLTLFLSLILLVRLLLILNLLFSSFLCELAVLLTLIRLLECSAMLAGTYLYLSSYLIFNSWNSRRIFEMCVKVGTLALGSANNVIAVKCFMYLGCCNERPFDLSVYRVRLLRIHLKII